MNEKRDAALTFAVNHSVGVLSTISPEGNPRSRVMYYTCDDSFNIYFLTLADTRKVADIAVHPYAAFVVSESTIPRTLQLEGAVTDLTERATLNPLMTNFIKSLMAHAPFGAPIEHFDASAMKWYQLTPTWIRWGDFTLDQGTDTVLSELI